MPEKLLIRAQSLPNRCEICHQSDCYDAANNHCSRCADLNTGVVTKKEGSRIQRNLGIMSIWVIAVTAVVCLIAFPAWIPLILILSITIGLLLYSTLLVYSPQSEVNSSELIVPDQLYFADATTQSIAEPSFEMAVPEMSDVSQSESAVSLVVEEFNHCCSKCGNGMEEGFITDFIQEKNKVDIRPGEWIEGRPEIDSEGIRVGGKRQLRISTYRCVECGYLEFYAR